MVSHRQTILSIALFGVAVIVCTWIASQPYSAVQNLLIIVGGVLLIFPVAWLGRKVLEDQPTSSRAIWVTTLVHYAVLIPLGAALARAVITAQDWVGWTLPIPGDIGWCLVIPTGMVALLAVANLAWKGLGAPFAIALSQRLSVDWMYAWTRNPMVLATLAHFVPNWWGWFNPELKEAVEGPAYTYPRYSSRMLAEFLRIAQQNAAHAQAAAPAVADIRVLLNANDESVRNELTKAVAAAWEQKGAEVKLHEFPTSAGLKHDMIDPGQPYQNVNLVYPVLLDAITEDAFTPAAAPGTQ